MIALILKDSFILFLLIYAILTLAEQLVHYLMRLIEQDADCGCSFHALDITNTDTAKLEYTIRRYAHAYRGTIILITEPNNLEATAIVQRLRREFQALYCVSHAAFYKSITSPKVQDVFLKAEQEANPNPNK